MFGLKLGLLNNTTLFKVVCTVYIISANILHKSANCWPDLPWCHLVANPDVLKCWKSNQPHILWTSTSAQNEEDPTFLKRFCDDNQGTQLTYWWVHNIPDCERSNYSPADRRFLGPILILILGCKNVSIHRLICSHSLQWFLYWRYQRYTTEADDSSYLHWKFNNYQSARVGSLTRPRHIHATIIS